ncbi:MAG TPA: bifunctional riboflavin kinase/FAD synthetase [Chitinophagaceae bacterium]|nr:bifunctional riboflavin kinase/FAD synthetase [Chitinophagaceae bacterium]
MPSFNKAVVTIGTFDGVHLGHQQIIEQLKKEAQAIGGETVLVTFDPHPRKIVSNKPLQLINSLPEKIELLQKQGVDNIVVVPFTRSFSSQTANEYVEDFLVKKFHPHTVIIGYDHRFGKDRSGDFHLLEEYAGRHAFKLIEIPVHLVDEAAISSTKIREALLNGWLEDVCRFLGYDYFFEGLVVQGNKLGRTIGYPTANLQPKMEDKLIPGNGVYAVTVEIIKEQANKNKDLPPYKGMMNIGTRPTVDGTKRVIEVNIFDFDEDIYGATLRVYLKKFLRQEQKFNGLDALKEQLAKDKLDALHSLTNIRY